MDNTADPSSAQAQDDGPSGVAVTVAATAGASASKTPGEDREYVVKQYTFNPRDADYKTLKALRRAFRPGPTDGYFGSGLNVHFKLPEREPVIGVSYTDVSVSRGKLTPMYEVISSSLLLYRLAAMEIANIMILKNYYKAVWDGTVEHIPTGIVVIFTEHKGAANVACGCFADELPDSLKQDLTTLLRLLVSDRSPHNYDGLVAGCVA